MNSVPNRRILLIDDTPAIHEDFRKILASTEGESELDAVEAALFGEEEKSTAIHFDLESAYQGQEGLAYVCASLEAGRPYAMAFVDMRMPPGWDGLETIQHIWQKDPRIQIVICTAYSDYSWEEILGKLAAGDRLLILKKPFANIEVYQLANSLTAKWEMTQQAAIQRSSLETAVEERTRELRTANDALQAEITERKLLESQLVHVQKMESIGQLASGIAHEINTPMQYISDNIRFLDEGFRTLRELYALYLPLIAASKEGAPTRELALQADTAAQEADIDYMLEEMPKAVEQSMDGIEHVSRIVQAMKHFSHPGSEEKLLTDINHVIESTIAVARNEWKYVANVVMDLDVELPLVPCLPGELSQVMLNLIINATHAISEAVNQNRDKGVITISTRLVAVASMDQVEIRIQDTGAGIPDAIRTRVFDPFFTTKEVGKGTGQGLSIAHSIIVEKHHGQIQFETELGKGTTFILHLPLHDKAQVEAA